LKLTCSTVLNPIAAGVAFIALLFALGSSVSMACFDKQSSHAFPLSQVISHILGSIVCFFAFIVAVVALGVDLGLFLAARHRFNSNLSGSPAELGNAMWWVFSSRRHKQRLIVSLKVRDGRSHLPLHRLAHNLLRRAFSALTSL
jgi:hypothetical protein